MARGGKAGGARHRGQHLGLLATPEGSHLVVDADGRFVGSVSGGCIEGR
jgi:hypothetical protein